MHKMEGWYLTKWIRVRSRDVMWVVGAGSKAKKNTKNPTIMGAQFLKIVTLMGAKFVKNVTIFD